MSMKIIKDFAPSSLKRSVRGVLEGCGLRAGSRDETCIDPVEQQTWHEIELHSKARSWKTRSWINQSLRVGAKNDSAILSGVSSRDSSHLALSSRIVSEKTSIIDFIPQAEVTENFYHHYEQRDWREYFVRRLKGKGLEIGPLHRPMLKTSAMQVDYVDRCSVAELREHYPELGQLDLVEPNIIDDAESLGKVEDESYDFVISAHVIEHMRNPLGALEQWIRVLKPSGMLYLIVPDKRAIFDKQRVRTTLEHLILDYKHPSLERDFEHYLDYAIHVQKKLTEAAIDEAKRLVEEDYSIHYHVFIPSDVTNLLNWFASKVFPIEVVVGPAGSPRSDEFHFLVRKGSQDY